MKFIVAALLGMVVADSPECEGHNGCESTQVFSYTERHPAAAHILVDRSVLRRALGDTAGADKALQHAVELMEASPEVFPEAYVSKQRSRLS